MDKQHGCDTCQHGPYDKRFATCLQCNSNSMLRDNFELSTDVISRVHNNKTIDEEFEELDKILLVCINKGFSNLKIVATSDNKQKLSKENRKRYTRSKLRVLEHMIKEGLVL